MAAGPGWMGISFSSATPALSEHQLRQIGDRGKDTGRDSKAPGANVIVFDIHGEYSSLSYASNIRIGEEFHFPVWMFGFQDIVANILKIREESATTVMTALHKNTTMHGLYPDGKEGIKPVSIQLQGADPENGGDG